MTVFVYSLTSILSAFLVFLIQPVAAKLALPTLGGTPTVWSGCMLFFQGALLAGYVYAHLLTGKVKPAYQSVVHLFMLAVAVSFFPMDFHAADNIDTAESPLKWLFAMMLYSVGVPYFVISATSPLLQRWFSRTGHPDAANPYFLYAASNVGSMGALLLYPFLIEPFATLAEQVRLWEIGVMLLAGLFLAVVLVTRRQGAAAVQEELVASDIAPRMRDRAWWLALSFVPSSLLYGVTAYITTDIASMPLLWVVPLALYLLTFIVVFSGKPIGVATARAFHLPMVAIIMFLLIAAPSPQLLILLLHLCVFYVVVLSVHSLLAERKPRPRYLTEFFLWMSLGGVLGGVFNTLVAPFVFNSIAEYPAVLIASCVLVALSPQWKEGILSHRKALVGLAALTLIPVVLLLLASWVTADWQEGATFVMVGRNVLILWTVVLVFVAYRMLHKESAAFLVGLGIVLAGFSLMKQGGTEQTTVLLQERSIFGVNRVVLLPQHKLHRFEHGTTNHGVQFLEGEERLQPKSYYTGLRENVFSVNHGRAIAVLGLGAGTMACYAKEGQEVDFFEIDPLVAEIASNPAYFTYLRDCPAKSHIIIGDGRKKIQEQPDGRYDVIVMDAFSSDAIPAHLLTREAVAMYREKLGENGVIAIHISNRHINLAPVVAAVAENIGMVARVRLGKPGTEGTMVFPAVWVVLADNAEVFSGFDDAWKPLVAPADAERFLWTDNFSNIINSIGSVREALEKELSEVSPQE